MINRCHPNRHRYRRRVEFPGDWPLQAQLAPDALERLDAILEANPELAAKAHEDPLLTRGVVVAARASRAITSFLMDHPIPSLSGPPTPEPDGADLNAVRRFVEGRLVRTAVRDLLGMADMPTVGRELADTADAAAAAALAIAMTTNPGPDIPFTVIAMGKWGAQELNYASDIDVLFVYDTPDGTDPDTARRHANHLAAGFIAALADVTTEGIAYRVDADLRPEGRNGPLARSIDSYAAYYERWAHTWEYQSLIKARPAAGDPTLGTAFTTLITPYVYPDTLPPDAIRDIRTMKARIEHQPRDTTFHLKHGPGGLSDVEFFVQLLQMRHGGTDRSLQAQGTIEALSRLTDAGALPDEQARDMIDAYRFCAHVRNRLYLQLGRPTDSIPIDALQGARLARSLGYQDSPRSALREDYRRITRRARKLVEQGFYRDL
jgi:glutamate-ammonia-ligase adenylyltransferase